MEPRAIASCCSKLGSIERHKDRPASLDPAPLGRSVPMPKRPMQCKYVQAHPLGSPQGRLGRAAPNQRSLMRPLDLGLQIPVLLHPRGPKRRFPFRRGNDIWTGWCHRSYGRAGTSSVSGVGEVPQASDQMFLLFVEPLAPTAQSRVGRC